MFKIYVTSHSKQIESSRLWRITAPNGTHNYILGTIHAENSQLLLNGTPEFNAIFASVKQILFEFADMQEINKSGIDALNCALSFKVDNKLVTATEKIKQQDVEKYNNFIYVTSNFVYQYFTTHHPQEQISLEQIKSLHFIALGALFNRLKVCDKPQLDVFDNVLFQEAKSRKQQSDVFVKNIESFDMLLQGEYEIAKLSNAQELEEIFSEFFLDIENQYTSTLPPNIRMQLEKIYYSGELYHLIDDAEDNNNLISKKFAMRNKLMLQACMPQFIAGDSLLCTGLSHCGGKKGLLQLLKDQNYNIEAVLQTPNLNLINKNIYNQIITGIFTIGLVASFLSALESKLLDGKYFATLLLSLVVLAGFNTDSTRLIAACGLLYNTINLMLTPGWIRLIAATLFAPLLLAVKDNIVSELEMRTVLINNCGPQNLHKEQKKRADELYELDGHPVVSRVMLTQFMRDKQNKPLVFKNIDNDASVQTSRVGLSSSLN